ncbi:hypothetical protein SETIT_3G290900v2 [Setaria italica]|uniref:Uncharacterized protein n=1 Tax=Setaria italica TaxID=4555 RepID=A0A368QK17_SETIT|nr:hypothetical protein SETIT_3G290900v2 [Setaria italica]
MARLTASLVWVAVLVVLGVGVTPGKGSIFDDFFGRTDGSPLADFLRTFPKWRIISKQDPNLSLAARNGTVVLAKTEFDDMSQVWIQDSISIGKLAADDGCRKPFALVNFKFNFPKFSAEAIVPSTDGSLPVKLAPYNPSECIPLSMLWTKKADPTSDFSAIRMFKDESKGFNGLGGYGNEGTVIGVLPTGDGANPNVQWKIVGFFSRP